MHRYRIDKRHSFHILCFYFSIFTSTNISVNSYNRKEMKTYCQLLQIIFRSYLVLPYFCLSVFHVPRSISNLMVIFPFLFFFTFALHFFQIWFEVSYIFFVFGPLFFRQNAMAHGQVKGTILTEIALIQQFGWQPFQCLFHIGCFIETIVVQKSCKHPKSSINCERTVQWQWRTHHMNATYPIY